MILQPYSQPPVPITQYPTPRAQPLAFPPEIAYI